METYYIVQYNDCYGNGDNKTIECLVKDKKTFKKWLKQHNIDRKSDGNEPEDVEEFDLIPVNLIN